MSDFNGGRPYRFLNKTVRIPRAADISRPYLPGGELAEDVQSALDEIRPWEGRREIVQSFETSQRLGATVVKLEAGEAVTWGINTRHRAKAPGPSPFVRLSDPDDPRRWTHTSTIHLFGLFFDPMLVRAYAGAEIEPLPWMSSIRGSEQRIDLATNYWQNHAFIFKENLVKEKVLHAPDWYEG